LEVAPWQNGLKIVAVRERKKTYTHLRLRIRKNMMPSHREGCGTSVKHYHDVHNRFGMKSMNIVIEFLPSRMENGQSDFPNSSGKLLR
jgi:hypothetical protein